MAKIVNTKYGDRRLVHLPPVNMSGTKTANVDTIAPRDSVSQAYDMRVAEAKAQYVHKQYAYRAAAAEGRKYETKNAWVGAPRPDQLPEGNLVNGGQPPRMGNQIFQQLYQEATATTMQNYNQGQYPVIPPVGGAPHYMQYTNQGLSGMPQAQQQPQPQMAPNYPQATPVQYPGYNPAPQAAPPVPQQQTHPPPQNVPQSNPNERHIYYGPNGEVLPGPPPGFNTQGAINYNEFPEDFAIEGVLHHGRLTHLTLIEASRGFPKIPDFLIRDLIEKYGHIERTVARIVMRGGQAYVHATPDILQESPRMETEYVPVYLEEGEEFDYDKFMSDYRNQRYRGDQRYRHDYHRQSPPRRYRSPPTIPRSYPRHDDERRRYSPDIRPETTDPISHLRWKKESDRHSIGTAPHLHRDPVFPVEPPTRDFRR